MLRDVEVQEPPALVADDKEAVEDTENDRGHGEEVHCGNCFPVIRKKRATALGWPELSQNPLHPAGDASLAETEAQHEQFIMNARRAASSISQPSSGKSAPELPSTVFSY
jgi:hypothetical protein